VIARINAKPEKALREALGSVPHVEEDQITASLAKLDDRERNEALGLAIIITSYVMIDVCGSTWPAQASIRGLAEDLAAKGTTARRLHLDAEDIHAYLSRVVLGPEQMEDVIPDEPQFTRLPLVVAQRALAVYCPKDMGMWDYLDRIESAIEIASALDDSVLPAAVMRAYLPKAKSLQTGFITRPAARSTCYRPRPFHLRTRTMINGGAPCTAQMSRSVLD
jgi:hypothetical protein